MHEPARATARRAHTADSNTPPGVTQRYPTVAAMVGATTEVAGHACP